MPQPVASERTALTDELFFGLSTDRLRRRALWAGAALSLSLLMPYEIIEDQPQFLWQLFGELPPSGVIAAFSSVAAGLIIFAAGRWATDALSLALVVIAAMLGASVFHKLGDDASQWGLLPLPASFSARFTLALTAMAATTAGTTLARQRSTRRASTILIGLGVLLAALFYLWPGRGQAPWRSIVDNLMLVPELPGFPYQLGAATLSLVEAWPLLITTGAVAYLRWPPRSSPSLLPLVSLVSFPVLLMMLLFARFARANAGSALFAAMGSALEVAAALALLAGAFEVFGQIELAPAPHAALRRTSQWCAATFLVAGLGMVWISRPPDKTVAWELGEPTHSADALFGTAVVRWNRAHLAWTQSADEGAAAKRLVRVNELAHGLVDEARAIDAGLADAIATMAQTGVDESASTRSWYRSVGAVNEACRDAGLPYYLDPEARVRHTKGGLRRRLSVVPFRVGRVRRFAVEGEAFNTLDVQSFAKRQLEHEAGLLGLSRDVQPFALIGIEAVEAHHAELVGWTVDVEVPRCGRTFEPEGDAVLARCGGWLAEGMRGPSALDALRLEVERHELQHQIDGPLLPMARSVHRKLAGYAPAARDRTNRELSAYLAQLTTGSTLAHLGLVTPLRFALLESRGTYHHAAVLMFEALGARRVRDARGRVEAARVAAVFDELLALDALGLEQRAAGAWRELFDDELPRPRLLGESIAPNLGETPPPN